MGVLKSVRLKWTQKLCSLSCCSLTCSQLWRLYWLWSGHLAGHLKNPKTSSNFSLNLTPEAVRTLTKLPKSVITSQKNQATANHEMGSQVTSCNDATSSPRGIHRPCGNTQKHQISCTTQFESKWTKQISIVAGNWWIDLYAVKIAKYLLWSTSGKVTR